jgi:hypothetical protein
MKDFALRDFVLLVVPAIIALAMVAAAIYLMVYLPDRKIPDFMVNSLTTILGYYFGVGVAKA